MKGLYSRATARPAVPSRWQRMRQRRLNERGRLTRIDTLPEHHTFIDMGCSLHPTCLSCPLPACRYDVHGGAKAIRARSREKETRVLRDTGMTAESIAGVLGVSRRTVYRLLSKEAIDA